MTKPVVQIIKLELLLTGSVDEQKALRNIFWALVDKRYLLEDDAIRIAGTKRELRAGADHNSVSVYRSTRKVRRR